MIFMCVCQWQSKRYSKQCGLTMWGISDILLLLGPAVMFICLFKVVACSTLC